MPLSASDLRDLLRAKQDAATADATATDPISGDPIDTFAISRDAALLAIAEAIVEHVTGNLTITITATAPSGGGPVVVSSVVVT